MASRSRLSPETTPVMTAREAAVVSAASKIASLSS